MEADRLGPLQLGVATSAYQIEGAVDRDGRGPSIWDVFARQPGAVVDGTSGAGATEHYDRLDDDLDLIAWLGVDVYRFSVAWPRVQPAGRGRANPAGLDFYDRLVDGLLARGIQPFVTLYHWDLPAELQEDGGWTARDTAGRFADYAELVARRLGDRVRHWVTVNEPWCVAILGHFSGEHAPGLTDDTATVAAAHHIQLAHGRAVEALRSVGDATIGLVVNAAPVWPAQDADDEATAEAVRLLDGVRNRWWLDSAVHGRYPADVLERFDDVADLSSIIRSGDLGVIGSGIDFVGVNYYYPLSAVADPGSDAGPGPGMRGIAEPTVDGWQTMMGWPVRPEGLAQILRRIHDDYGQPPIWVTENGAALDDAPGPDGQVDDPRRVEYLDRHLSAALDARDAGVDLRGYLVWSLLDNFEWSQGYGPRFGIVHVDYDTMARTPKTSAHWLRQLASERPR